EHFVAITDAMNQLGGDGLWDETDGFYYDKVHFDGTQMPLRVRSLVGAIPLMAVGLLEEGTLAKLPGFCPRLAGFFANRKDLADHTTYMARGEGDMHGHRLLAIPSKERLVRVLRYVLDEAEFLSPYGVRALSRVHKDHPYSCNVMGVDYRVDYTPAEGTTALFGGNSNWRGPLWFPLNYLLLESLLRYHHFYGDELRVEFPTGSGQMMTLEQVAQNLARRLANIFLPDRNGRRPAHGDDFLYASDPHWKDLVLF